MNNHLGNTNNFATVTLQEFVNNFYESVQYFTAQVYSIPNAPSNHLDYIVSSTSDLISSAVKELESNIFHILSKYESADENFAASMQDVKDMFFVLADQFEHVRSEYQRLQNIEKSLFLYQT